MIIGIFAIVQLFAGQSKGQSQSGKQPHFRTLMNPPPDSAEAERVRIWVPQELVVRCRAEVNILDNSGRVIRHLVNQLLYQDYYNFYWDKKDDNGQYVDSGVYKYDVNDCGGNKDGKVEARFKKWELLSRIIPLDTASAGRVDINLLADSALVSIEIRFLTKRVADAPITDSVFMAGNYHFNWIPAPLTRPGRYRMTVTVGDFQKTFQFMYRKKK